MTKEFLCIYHGACDDGFASAWIVRRALGEDRVDFYPGVYQKHPPDITGRNVIMVDFSYKRPVIDKMRETANSILILDHHKTAQADLADILPPISSTTKNYSIPLELPRMSALFDMEKCGASLTWDFFFPDQTRPNFIHYIEDRDLWKKQLKNGDEFSIALRSYPQDFKQWDKFILEKNGVGLLISEGQSIQRYYRLRVEEFKANAYYGEFEMYWDKDQHVNIYEGMFANAPYFAASEVAGELCNDLTMFGACYFHRADGMWQYSLRSRSNFDVSVLAKYYGGGGHANAAGFAVKELVHDRR